MTGPIAGPTLSEVGYGSWGQTGGVRATGGYAATGPVSSPVDESRQPRFSALGEGAETRGSAASS